LLCAHGLQPDNVWDMTLGECMAVAQDIEQREKKEREQQAMLAWKTAEMVGQYVAYMFAKSAPRPQTLYQAFPWLEKPEEDWQRLKARFTAKAEVHNARAAGMDS
jgi:hypothetical protein